MKPIRYFITILCIVTGSLTQAGETTAIADSPKSADDEFRLRFPKKDHLTTAQLYQMGPNIDDFYSSVRKIIAEHFPRATDSNTDTTITFDYNTRLFKIHEPSKIGEWQDASEERGPKRGGIFCEIVSEAGVYNGQAEVPQTFDKGYFRVLLLAPYSKRLDRHLHVLLSYPADTSKDFLREFTEAINTFNGF